MANRCPRHDTCSWHDTTANANTASWTISWREIGTVEDSTCRGWRKTRTVEDSASCAWREIGTVEELQLPLARGKKALKGTVPFNAKMMGRRDNPATQRPAPFRFGGAYLTISKVTDFEPEKKRSLFFSTNAGPVLGLNSNVLTLLHPVMMAVALPASTLFLKVTL